MCGRHRTVGVAGASGTGSSRTDVVARATRERHDDGAHHRHRCDEDDEPGRTEVVKALLVAVRPRAAAWVGYGVLSYAFAVFPARMAGDLHLG